MLPRYTESVQTTQLNDADIATLCHPYIELYQAPINQAFRTSVGQLLDNFAANNGLSKSFRDAQVSDRAFSFTSLHVLIA